MKKKTSRGPAGSLVTLARNIDAAEEAGDEKKQFLSSFSLHPGLG
jgi:hypothetical protein